MPDTYSNTRLTTTNMTSSFSRPPLEVMTMILQYAPDLPSIYKLICASASAKAAFQIESACILENAIERSIPEYKHLARMIAILGSYLASSSHPTFEELVDTYHNLLEDALTTAPASSVFRSGPGSRYLILTAYRIETLQHICFVYLLQNVHEVVWSVESTDESHLYPLKNSKNNVSFEAAAWWSPSWVEKTRITRALWKVMVYWNIQAISPVVMVGYEFSRYRAKIQHLSPCIGPDLPNHSRWEKSFHEIEEFKCVLTATRDLLDYPHEPFTPFTGHHTSHNFRVKEWISSTIFKETLNWKFEEPNPTTGRGARKHEHASSVNEMNNPYRDLLWRHVFKKWYGCTTPKPGDCNPPYLDYLGLCIWDSTRQGLFGLAIMCEKYPGRYSGPLRNPKYFSGSPYIVTRWGGLFMREVTRLPRGQSRQLGKGLKMLAQVGIREQKDVPTS